MDLENLKNNPEQIKLLINLLSSLLPEDKPVKKAATKKTKNSNNNPTVSKIKTVRGKTKASGNNKFDSMPERNAHKEDVEIDKKLIRYPPTERSRPVSLVSLRCRCCGKTEKVNPGLVLEADRYKCNKCSISAG